MQMILNRLTLLKYKNIAAADITFSPKINCLTGSNGEGKTNVLDAVFYLSFGHSASVMTDALAVRHGEEEMMLQGRYVADDKTGYDVTVAVKPHKSKRLSVNKKACRRIADHIGLIPLVMVSPEDTDLVKGGGEARRRFMDIVISQYDRVYLNALLAYNKALRQRNALLRAEAEPDPLMMDIYEQEMAEKGELIFASRQRLAERIEPLFARYYSAISSSSETPSLRYVSHCQRGPLLATLREGRQRDRIVGYSLHGIHRDDLEMSLGDYPIKSEASQGQTKSFLLALKFAQFGLLRSAGVQETPLLLLDDLFDKLDEERVGQIVRLVSGDDFGQIFITDTDRERLSPILERAQGDYKVFSVRDGEVTL